MIQVAVLGYGTVGSGVVEVINTNSSSINKKAGEEINIKYVLDLRDFPGDPVQEKIVHDFDIILNDPEILVLDEPTSGLDPGERVRFRNIISSLGKNRLVILSTHIVSDIEYIADKIMIMKNGQIMLAGDEAQILKEAEGCVWKCVVPENQVDSMDRKYVISNLRNQANQVELRIVSTQKPAEDAEPVEVTLEDAYLFFTKKKYSVS